MRSLSLRGIKAVDSHRRMTGPHSTSMRTLVFITLNDGSRNKFLFAIDDLIALV